MEIKAWIQNTDVTKNDFVLKNGQFVEVQEDRDKYVKLLFDIQKESKCIYKIPYLSIFRGKKDKTLFFIDIKADNVDQHNRRVAVIFSVEGYATEHKNQLEKLIDETFSKTNTEVSEENKQKILEILEGTKENILKSENSLYLYITAGAVLAVLAVLLVVIKYLTN